MSFKEAKKRISSAGTIDLATYMTRNGLIATCLFGLLIGGSGRAHGLDPSRHITQYAHTAWRVRDGYFQAPPLAIAQTKDGQLWLGGEGGLLRFDGVQFSSWKPPGGQALPSERIYGLLGSSDGGLWIGTGRGLAQWKNDRLTIYATMGRFSSLIEDHQGTIWAGHTRAIGDLPPLCRFAGNDFKCFEFANQPGMSWVGALKEDRNGDLWIATAGAVCRQPKMGETNCYLIPNLNPSETAGGVQCMAIDSDDAVWLDGGVTGIWQLKSGRWKRYREFPQLKLELTSALLDREGGLWFGDRNHGLFRHIEGRTEQFNPTDGLSSETVTSIFEDREGTVWTATNAGLDRFRDVKVATITPREGLPVPAVGSVQASRNGGLWIAGLTQLIHAKFDRPDVYRPVGGLPESGDLGTVFEDSRGRLWLGVGQTLAWRENGQFHEVSSLRLHQVGERVLAISEDVEGSIWVGTTDPDFALLRLRAGRVLEKYTHQQLGGQVSAMAADPTGGMWLSRAPSPGLILARNGKFEAHADEFPESAGNMFSDSHGLWASTSKGVFAYANGIVKKLTTQNGLSCDNLDAAIKDDSGALWLRGTCGLMQVPASELELWWKDPSRRVQIKYLDAFDGSQAGTSSFVHVAKTSDGRIWFALEEVGVQVVDPKRLQDNPAAPPVAVTRLVADHRPYPLNTKLRLPALTRDLEIDYTAYSLAVPEKVRFHYRLEGVDKTWQDVETRRQAYFTNLRPGSYRFAVSAANNDGVWNEQGAILDFSIAPAWFQTIWFRTVCVVALFGLLWGLYWMRLRQVRHEFNVSMEARVNERTQIINAVPTLAWSARPDGAAEFFNQRWLDYTGLTLKQAEGWGWSVALHPDDLDRMVSYWCTAIATGEPVEIEGRLRRFDGWFRWFLFRANAVRDESGTIVKWYGTNTDIDDRKRAAEQVRRSEAFLVEGQSLSRTGTYSWRPDTGEITWSKELYRIFEVEPGTAITLDLTLTRIHPDDIPSVREVETRGLQSASDYEHSFRILLPDGRIKFVHVMARATRDADGRTEFIGAAQDITESKAAEEALNRARSELAHVSRVTTLNALTASIAHEINQPLASLLTNASSCLRRLNAEPPNLDGARETAQRTIRDVNRATDVITRLRALFSKKEFRAETLDLNEVTREVIALSLNDLQRSGVILRSEFAEDLPFVIGDRIQLQQVTLNLLRNASDAMGAVDDRPRQLLIRTQREGDDRVCLNVQDSGCGVNPQDFEKLFEAFYTTKRGGMGIGLSLSRSIIEKHHGRLWAEKNDGPGTTFSFSIPCCPETPKDVSANGKRMSA